MKIRPWFVVLMVSAMLAVACSKPVPSQRVAYVGYWESPEMRLLISADGNVKYERRKAGGSTVSLNGPLQGFKGHDFIVGVGPLSTTFVVSKPPHRVGGEWRMVVDGVELTKRGGGDEYNA